MKRLALALILASSSTTVLADQTLCLEKKYDSYVDASLNWYEDLVGITTQLNPELTDVGQWFLKGRTNHFELNREAVHYYLSNDPSKVATEQPVEAWLKLEQKEIKVLASRSDKLGQLAKRTFEDRQSKPHNQNYELRTAFAELLSHPKKIDSALNKYNQSVTKLEEQRCN
ncbi:conserved hypothetical protein [Vibrio nigripulchritudo SO65]|uniref:Uncharacterized protein n=1 Tax=Vibrio nigripulchritudo SOn1 TaxID=1238450 RepID=A0AAV2VZ75_9VIBR|nr:hypothetical protein [Vibrio nigripulchritudo]CCN34974.1 conserved hypothetical protein [Vibrio nigripulchritudo AM115]CCN39647.1 conserved hypothetical protein [Vibrio nigripulchritudo FTn2]CCN63274.1 conserved hypothetical protein [Vibrio nigripulchritudo POn4]CCN77896.1 conserved hypothetical protein [Vibrio nigripulchritudo SO65]CCO50008.1 conserved hypothetical protein [Vibrio nigripulchritudo SOn1]